MTVEEKLATLKKYCRGHICTKCPLEKICWAVGEKSTPLTPYITDDKISIMYSTLLQYMNGGSTMKKTTMDVAPKGDKTMEERTLIITANEYRRLVAAQTIIAKLEVYTETHEYLNDDFIRTLLGTQKPNPERIESEGD